MRTGLTLLSPIGQMALPQGNVKCSGPVRYSETPARPRHGTAGLLHGPGL